MNIFFIMISLIGMGFIFVLMKSMWRCCCKKPKDAYDPAINSAEAQPPRCPKLHDCDYVTESPYRALGADQGQCNICKKLMYPPFWHCDPCLTEFDICDSCAKA